MNKIDTIMEVTIHYFKKGDKIRLESYEDLSSLDYVCDIKRATEKLPEEKFDDGEIHLFRKETHVFNQDWIGFSFCSFGEESGEFSSGVDYLLFEYSPDEFLQQYREDFLKWADNKTDKMKRILVACNFSEMVPDIWSGTEYECEIEVFGRVDMKNLNLIEERERDQ